MLIKNTDHSYCKIKETKISGLKAYVTLIIYSSAPQTSQDIMGNINRVFSFYLRDLNSTHLYRLPPYNNYWIDRNTNYHNDSASIDVNMYKEIILEIDITNANQSDMIDNHWIRKCNIVMIDHTTNDEEAWVSPTLELISKGIKLPTLSNLQITSDSYNALHVNFKYTYESQEDFNYINNNLITIIEVKSASTDSLVESCEFPHEYNSNTKESITMFTSLNTYTEPLSINILLKNIRGDVLSNNNYFYNPAIGNINLSIKDKEPLHVKAAYIKDGDIKHVKTITIN